MALFTPCLIRLGQAPKQTIRSTEYYKTRVVGAHIAKEFSRGTKDPYQYMYSFSLSSKTILLADYKRQRGGSATVFFDKDPGKMAEPHSSLTFSFSGVNQKSENVTNSSLDDLTASLAGSFRVSSELNNPTAPHPRFSQYKAKYSSMAQSERRRKILQLQKEKRLETVNLVRRLAEDTWEEDKQEMPQETADDEEDMEVTEAKIRKPGKHYKNQLMLSEWMLDIPEDFESDWIMVPCPVGRRSLIIASMGDTSHYTKSGYRMNRFPSALPGGKRGPEFRAQDCAILDTIFSEASSTYYILDVMCWKQMPFYDSETEFRMYWLHSQFQEHPELQVTGKKNPYRFEPLPNFSCVKGNIEKVMAVKMNIELDGLLFYHKKTHYTFGSTPLVLWLKPYMLPELLGVMVPELYFANIPSHYEGFDKHRQTVKQEKATVERNREKAASGETPPQGNRKKKTQKRQSKMELSSELDNAES